MIANYQRVDLGEGLILPNVGANSFSWSWFEQLNSTVEGQLKQVWTAERTEGDRDRADQGDQGAGAQFVYVMGCQIVKESYMLLHVLRSRRQAHRGAGEPLTGSGNRDII